MNNTQSVVSFNMRGVIQSGPQDFVISRDLNWIKTLSAEIETKSIIVAGETFGLRSLRSDKFSFVKTEQKYWLQTLAFSASSKMSCPAWDNGGIGVLDLLTELIQHQGLEW